MSDSTTTGYPETLRYDGDEAVVECLECDREFRVTLHVRFSYTMEAT